MKPWQMSPRHLAWLIKTHALKTWIGLEMRYSLFSYSRWIRQNEPGPKELVAQQAVAANLESLPKISIIVVSENQPMQLARTQATLDAQTYSNWKACIIHSLVELVETKPVETQPIETMPVETQLIETSTGSRQARPADWPLENLLAELPGEWVIFLTAGDTLSPHALYTAAVSLQANSQADILYPDEDTLAANGVTRHSPFCKPDFSPDLLLSVNYLRGAFIRREHLVQCIRQSASVGEALLRCVETARQVVHLPQILLHHPSHAAPTGSLAAFFCPTFSAAERVEHLRRCGLREPRIEVTPRGERFTWESDQSLVSIIIPSKNKIEYLRRCIESIQRVTAYPRYEIIIVDNDSHDPATLDYYAHLPADVRLLENHDPFNYSAYNNRGAQAARGALLLFLNNDVEIIEPYWLDELARWAQRPEVGAVGAKLLYPDGSLQHAGIIIGMEGHGSHVFGGMPEDSDGPWGMPGWYRDVSAVTGACLMMRRPVFEQIGGFDEAYILVFNDIEICVRALAHGYRVVYNPFVRLIHYEGKSRGHYIPPADIRLGFEHLKAAVTRGDPYYNPQLSDAVRRPTLRRASEQTRRERLEMILAIKSR
jgi:GT2 family glycosyltransferase